MSVHASDDEMSVRSDMSLKLERLRTTHTFPRDTKIESVEYGEVKKKGFTQIYINRPVACIVTWRNQNDEVILWPDYHTENWLNGKFDSMQYKSVQYRYSSPEGRTKWQEMWKRDGEWYKHAKEFYLEDNQTSMPPAYVPTPASPLRETDYPWNSPHHPAQAHIQTLLYRMNKINI